ncbi:filamentous hemagglutinin [Pseudomonas trivialis]|uniref:Filamentous hemagglutinin n=1 Tax=Pseudomonas trivialis TaxID=200450 RepID=A0ABY0U637_9PSED|nr:filamentous hemagglutinin [Pseudomonas trivialis]
MDNVLASKDALNHDIVWMENRVIDGQTVLVPVLYLAQAEARNVRGNSLIQGRDLNLVTGGDLINVGTLRAGRDLNLIAASDTSVKHEIRDGGEKSSITTDVKNLAASVTAGGNLTMKAGQDVNVIGSSATAGKDLTVEAGRDFNVASVSDMHNVEGKEKHGKKRIKTSDDQTTQVASVLTAGGDFVSQAGRDTTIVASKISAGNEAYLYSGDKLSLLAAQDSTHTLYDMKEKGSWGAKKAQMDEVTRTTQVGTEIKTGDNLVLKSGGDQLYQVAKLNSGKDIILDSGGAVVFEGVKDLHDESHTKSKSDLSWFSAKGKGNTDETLRQSELVAQGQLVIKAAEGIRIDVKQVDQQTVSQTVDAMVKADPNLAWLKQAEARGDIDWRQVKEIHESFKYDNSGLGAGAKIAIAIMMAAIMGPVGFGLQGATLAVSTSLSTTAVTSTINNKGNLGAALKETASANSLKSAAVAGFTAGALEYADTNWFAGADGAGAGTTTVQGVTPSTGSTLAVTNSSKDIFTWTSAGDIALRTGGRAVISSGISTAVQGGSFGDNFNAALLGEAGNVAMATGFNWVGDYVTFPNGSPQKIIAHALMGGLLAEATGSDFKTGAASAGLNEALINQLVWAAQGNDDITLMLSQLTGLLAAAAVDGDLEKGSQIAQKATTFNYLYHEEVEEMLREVDSKATEQEKLEVRQRYAELDQQRNDELDALCARDPQRCRGIATSLANDDQKLVDLVGRLRSQGQGGAASAVGFVIGNNLDASSQLQQISALRVVGH